MSEYRHQLTQRQREILQAVADCGSAKAAARNLGLHNTRVNHIVAEVRQITGFDDRNAAIAEAKRRGWIR